MSGVTGRQEDDHLLIASADRRTGHSDRLNRSPLLDPGRISRRRVPAVEPEVAEVAVDAEESGGQRKGSCNERHRPAERPAPSGTEPAGQTGVAGRDSDVEPAIRLRP